jgi:tetratricopeptide (TPR) repeat protein
MSGRGGWTRLVVMALLLGLWSLPVQAQEPPPQLHALNQQVTQLYEAGKYAEAIPIAQRALELAERQFGPDHPEVGTALNNLAELFRQQRRYFDAEALTERSLSIYEKALGPEHPSVATARGHGGTKSFARALATRLRSLNGTRMTRQQKTYRHRGWDRYWPLLGGNLCNGHAVSSARILDPPRGLPLCILKVFRVRCRSEPRCRDGVPLSCLSCPLPTLIPPTEALKSGCRRNRRHC